MKLLNSDKVRVAGFVCLSLFFLSGTALNAENKRQTARKYQNVTVRLEARGTVVSTPEHDSDKPTANRVPMKIAAVFKYEELIQYSKSGIRSVRFYENASADIELNKKKETSKLADDNRYILINRAAKEDVVDRVAFASIAGRLNQRQWQLIDVPASSTLVGQLIKEDKLKVGNKWKPDLETLADLVLVHEIDQSDVEIQVDSINNAVAKLTINGAVQAADDDVQASIRINGKIFYNTRTQRVTRVQWSLRHKKDEGQIAPGFDVLIKVQVDIQPTQAPRKLTTDNIVRVRGNRKINSDLILENPSKRTQLVHDRRWRSVINSPEATILRLLDKGQIIGQCNVLVMPHLSSQDALSLKGFEASVSKAITEKGKVVSATQRKTKNGNLIYSVEAAGVQDNVELTWIYHNVTQPNGQRAMLIITTETDLAETIRDSELKMVDSIEIRSIEQANEIRKRAAQQKPRKLR